MWLALSAFARGRLIIAGVMSIPLTGPPLLLSWRQKNIHTTAGRKIHDDLAGFGVSGSYWIPAGDAQVGLCRNGGEFLPGGSKGLSDDLHTAVILESVL